MSKVPTSTTVAVEFVAELRTVALNEPATRPSWRVVNVTVPLLPPYPLL